MSPPTNFSPETSTNEGVSPKNVLAFGLNTFATLVQHFKAIPSAEPKLLNLKQDSPSKKVEKKNPSKKTTRLKSL